MIRPKWLVCLSDYSISEATNAVLGHTSGHKAKVDGTSVFVMRLHENKTLVAFHHFVHEQTKHNSLDTRACCSQAWCIVTLGQQNGALMH